MSHLHYVATDEYRQRVIQLGEQPDQVFLVGALGIDNIARMQLLERGALETALDFKFGRKNLLITFHPVTLDVSSAENQMRELLAALAVLDDTKLIFTLPNADTDGRIIIDMVKNFVAKNSNARAYTSLGQLHYFSCVAQVDGVVGNSSSGLLEVPSFQKGTIDVGDRQRGRLKAQSVISCDPTRDSIGAALTQLYSSNFQAALVKVCNPYGEGGATTKIFSSIKTISLDGIIKKRFYDKTKV